MTEKIRVLVNGAKGNMGKETVEAVLVAEGLELAACVDLTHHKGTDHDLRWWAPIPGRLDKWEDGTSDDLGDIIKQHKPDVMVDFTHPVEVFDNVRVALNAGAHCVVGTTGLTPSQIGTIETTCKHTLMNCFIAPNFALQTVATVQAALGFVKITKCAVEIIERHRLLKADAPSGTAKWAAETLSPHVSDKYKNAAEFDTKDSRNASRGEFIDGIAVHAVRGPGYVAGLEILCMHEGGTTPFSDEVKDRAAFMPGVELAIHKVVDFEPEHRLTVGLENILPGVGESSDRSEEIRQIFCEIGVLLSPNGVTMDGVVELNKLMSELSELIG